MAGNGIDTLPHEIVTKMKYAKKVNYFSLSWSFNYQFLSQSCVDAILLAIQYNPSLLAGLTHVLLQHYTGISNIPTISYLLLTFWILYFNQVDFRMNELILDPEEASKFGLLEHLTHLDIRDNKVGDIDLRPIKTLEYLNCGRNEIGALQINGLALKNLFAAHNSIEKLTVNPKPEWLLQIDVSQ